MYWPRIPWGVLLVALNLSLLGYFLHRRVMGKYTGPTEVDMEEFGFRSPTPSALEISGTVSVDPARGGRWPRDAVVFLIARPEEGGPPVAVRRLQGVRPPFDYVLKDSDRMVAGRTLPERVVVSARVDQDGNASTRQSGDLEGFSGKGAVSIRALGVDIRIK